MKIDILSDEMASRIAAGEVVERPASVVKELIENSLDAGATEISAIIEKSGTSLIRITDNGEGIAAEDLPLAVERHSTSKLRDEADLFRIATLGFRGEALPSIASVSKMEIISRPAGGAIGYGLRVDGGKKQEPRPASASVGTTVAISDIFFNTPARRKFLKSPATELSHICDVFNRLALAYPAVHFRLAHDGRIVADYLATNEAKDRLHQVLGANIARDLIPCFSKSGDLIVTGYLSATPNSFPNPRYLLTFVNGRCVRDKILNHAVLHGYETLLMKGQYPAAVVFVNLPYDEVDVNVHPAKYEVRFRRQSEAHDTVARAIREALKLKAKEPSAGVYDRQARPVTAVMECLLPYAGSPSRDGGSGRQTDASPASAGIFLSQENRFSSMTILGQIFGCYLVCSSTRGLALIDQHAAHERVAFERLRQQLHAGEVQKQTLLVPQTIDVSPGEATLLEQKMAPLKRFGFILEVFGPHSYAITAVPALLPEGDYREIVRRVVADLAEVDESEAARQHLEERLATIACHSVIRANRKLETREIQALLQELDRIDFATQCPHGRPVLIEFRVNDLEKMFKRV
ncbi:MAG: DNA mismatch repair endonuclease MutL [Candidatus Binatia bacterium]